MKYFILCDKKYYVKLSMETGIWPLTKDQDIRIDNAQRSGPVTFIVKAQDESKIYGFFQIRDSKTSKCITSFAKLPPHILRRWHDLDSFARGVCKVTWVIFNEISSENLKVSMVKLHDGRKIAITDCPSGSELEITSGHNIVKAIWAASKNIAPASKPNREQILFVDPKGYYNTLKNFTKEKFSLSSGYLKNLNKKFYPHSELMFDQMTYEEYLDYHTFIRLQIKLVRNQT